eukprot:3658249-Amphidinium_carterae.1
MSATADRLQSHPMSRRGGHCQGRGSRTQRVMTIITVVKPHHLWCQMPMRCTEPSRDHCSTKALRVPASLSAGFGLRCHHLS